MRKTLTPEEIEKLRTGAKWDCTFGRVTMTKLLDHIDSLDNADKIQVRAIDNLKAKIDGLEVELAHRNTPSGDPVGYFAYSEDGGYEEFATQEEAIACAKGDIDTARGDSCDGWPDSVNSIVWGVVMQRATQTGLREKDDNDNVATYITEVCDYDLLPAITSTPQPINATHDLNVHEKMRLIEFAEKYIQRQSTIMSKLPTDICQEKLIGIALEALNAPPAPATGINANHSDPDLSPGDYSVNISTKGGAVIINGAPVASVLLDTAKILDTPFLEGDSIYWQLVTGLVDQENEQREIFAAEIVRAIINAAGMQPVSAVPVVFTPILTELERAMRKFPTWPTDPIHASKILDEEVGELSKAVLQATYEPHKSGPAEVRAEAIQAAAMAIRFIASLHKYQYVPSAQHEQPALANGDKAVDHV
ncbi:hypothetical protein GTU79_19730 [Sodalis ligni]|uniref:hypothetical protein n=1 Tax=Sodalis ligni TaxID=2697027 RepID=UPI001BDF47E3|nr:hypothetical protein [Sodalis ligni]QWA09570.1 hypothetical protein GTU79_19730 [Sodalis ligni]